MSFDTLQPILVPVLAALAAMAAVVGVGSIVRRTEAQRRLDTLVEAQGATLPSDEPSRSGWVETVVAAARPIARLSLPDAGWEDSALRRRFMHAGLRSHSAPVLFFAIKTLLAFGVPMLIWLLRHSWGLPPTSPKLIFAMATAGAIGFYGPNLVLNSLIERRQREILDHFPDAIDLLTICVEAGLGLDAALRRVADEMTIKSPVLAEELQLVTLEMRVGAGKDVALRNLAVRTGVQEIDMLVSTLIQSEKFGTSIGESLRVHADMLRTKRRQRAEERAAKLAVKLIFPLVLCILPSLLIVIAGPAAIQIGETFSKVGKPAAAERPLPSDRRPR
jgi:tight adherence protein C